MRPSCVAPSSPTSWQFKIRKEVYPIARMCGRREMYLEEQKMPPPTKSYMKH
jgi:hypothetical protein